MSPAVGRAGCPFLQNASSISQGALPVLMQRFRTSCPFLASVPAAAPAHGRGVATKMEMKNNNSLAGAEVTSTLAASAAVSACPVMATGRAVTQQQPSSSMHSAAATRPASAPSSPIMTAAQKKKHAELAAQMAAQISLLENQSRAVKTCPHAKAKQEAAELASNGLKSHAAANPGVHSAEGTFAGKMDSLKAEGRYRVFFDIQRQCGAFPKAYNHSTMRAAEKNLPEEVTVWCNNGTK